MNKKFAKLSALVVGTVMCGSLAMGFAACGPKKPVEPTEPEKTNPSTVVGNTYADLTIPTAKATTSATEIISKLVEKDQLSNYALGKNSAWNRLQKYYNDVVVGGKAASTEGKQAKLTVGTYTADTTIRMDIGDNAQRSISFNYGGAISGSITLPDGKTYTSSSLKPAWAAMEAQLGLKIQDKFSVTSNKVTTAMTSTTEPLSGRDIITDGAKNITDNADKFLDLSNYLDEMPNYKAFLEANPIVRLSMTSNDQTGAMYYAPYFDGNNDIEKYEIFKTNWVAALLNATTGDTTTTFKAHAEAKELAATTYASAEAYMGTTGEWSTTVLDKDGAKLEAGITVSYEKALAAAKDETTALGAAIKEAAGKAYTTEGATSGNIVDMMNFAINYTAGEVTGAKLLKVLQEYIKVAYYVGGTDTPFYTQTGYKLSDIVTGNSAAWDVDILTALGRCLVTNPSLLLSGKEGKHVGDEGATPLSALYAITARQGNMQRMVDTTALVGELYGVRGLESRNLYSYVDAQGQLVDTRATEDSYKAMNAFSKLYAEGLVADGGSGSSADHTYYKEGTIEALMMHDYVNTQTPTGFQLQGTVSDKYALEAGYEFTPVITPVSKWKTAYDATTGLSTYAEDLSDVYFRFTESWRSVKDSGFAVPLDSVKNDPAKLAAVLKLIDTMFTESGMYMLTYGPMAESADGANGFWYNREATAAEIAAGKYFEYFGKKLYSEVLYGGKYQPNITDNVYNAYYGKEVNGIKYDGSMKGTANAFTLSATLNYTNFARYVIGSAVNLGNKLQSFEYQMTSEMGRKGAAVVDTALDAGVIRHVELALTENPWYTSCPTVLPFTEAEKATNTSAINVSDFNATRYFTNNKNAKTNLFFEIIKNGFNAANFNAMFDQLGLTK